MSRSLVLKITGGLSLAALLTALAIAVWPASNTDKARSDGEALGAAVASLNSATTQEEIDAALVDISDAAADTRDHAGDEFSQDIYEWELEDAHTDLNGNAEDFRTEGPEVQQAFWEGYQSTI